jgi:hypothetical protein
MAAEGGRQEAQVSESRQLLGFPKVEVVDLTWDDLCPDGARRFYEGDDLEGFRADMWEEFSFEVAADDPEFPPGGWCEERGWAFTIPEGLVAAIYGSDRWPLGS